MRDKGKINKSKIVKFVCFIFIVLVVLLLIWFLYIYPFKNFKDNELILKSAGERYFEINKARLPKEEGRVLSVTLSTLIKQDYLDDLYEAYGHKLCDINESKVKAVNKNGEYEYYTYLKCGSFESDVDNEGPSITLNGSKMITISKGEEYKELGVKKVSDNVDGKIDISKVTIKGNVDTTKVGKYEVTYTVRDSLDNKTTVTRKVLVEEKLASTVRNNTNNGYYVGNVTNNYIYFNNMLFRIVRVNDDDSILIVSNDALANVDYTNDGSFEGSSLDKWLNNYFYNLLDSSYRELIVSSSWCDQVLTEDNLTTKECKSTTKKRKIGILSIQDYNMSYDGVSSYLDKTNYTWYSNLGSDGKAYGITGVAAYPGSIAIADQTSLLNVVPALNLNKDTAILDGDGSVTNPYIILEDNVGRKNSNLNNREIGEYVKYSGYIFRISDILKDGSIEVIMDSVLSSNSNQVNISYTNKQKEKVYNPNQEGNIAYKIKNEMTRYIDTKLFVKTKIEVPIYSNKITYKSDYDTKAYNLLITIPSTFDIFSARSSNSNDSGYWLIDSSKKIGIKAVVRSSGTLTYSNTSDNITAGLKIKAYFGKDVLIKDGSGTILDPYTLIS